MVVAVTFFFPNVGHLSKGHTGLGDLLQLEKGSLFPQQSNLRPH